MSHARSRVASLFNGITSEDGCTVGCAWLRRRMHGTFQSRVVYTRRMSTCGRVVRSVKSQRLDVRCLMAPSKLRFLTATRRQNNDHLSQFILIRKVSRIVVVFAGYLYPLTYTLRTH